MADCLVVNDSGVDGKLGDGKLAYGSVVNDKLAYDKLAAFPPGQAGAGVRSRPAPAAGLNGHLLISPLLTGGWPGLI